MSGIVSGIDYNLLFSSGTIDAAANILGILFNSSTVTATNFVSSGNPITDLKVAQQDQTQDVAREAQQPQVINTINAFKTAVANSTSIQQALLNPNVQQVLLTASGLSGYIGETATVQKLFLSDPSQPNSLVNQFGDPTLLSTVQTYDFAKNGLAELRNPKVVSALTDGYTEVMWRQSLDQATPGLSNALSFLGQASSITSLNDVLDNETNFEVITTALGIPQTIINQDTSAQTAALGARLDVAKLQDPTYVTSLTDQYLLSMQENSGTSSASSIAGLIV